MASNTSPLPASAIKRRTGLIGITVVLLGLSMVMQNRIDPGRKAYHDKETGANTGSALGGLNNEFMLLPLLGFREAAAGLLWVRCDEFFHSGDYDAILPLVRLITWLDPHADNVYVTGAWHLDYNFTDAAERSDRRYIAPAISLLDEGILNNPNIPDIKFEKGWQCFDKIKDFESAQRAFEAAIAGPNKDEMTVGPKDQDNEGYWPYAAPLKDLHMLAHTLEKRGRIPEAIAEWDRALARSSKALQKAPTDFSQKSLHSAEVHNRAEALQRYNNRYTAANHDHNNPTKYPAVYAAAATGGAKPGPFDVSLKPVIDVPRKYTFKISGRINLADGGRVDVRISDWNYKDRVAAPDLRALEPPDLSQTILIDSISVRKSTFAREMDMSKDPKMYSFSNKEKQYKIVLTFNSRTTSPHIQDFAGWSGEGLTDSHPGHVILDTHPEQLATTMIVGQDGALPVWDGKTVPFDQYGQPIRIIRVTFKVSEQQVLGNKPITNADIVPNDPNTTVMLK
jgi:tetratricopeptide (TPR) repeat protein